MNANVGKLERVPLRAVWKHEAYDFTKWLQENIDALTNVVDINLVNVDREQAAGSFSVDLVAEDDAGGTYIIENQLGKSDHDHLGKLITYLTAMTARGAVWIVSDPRPEHVAAVAWLNESTSADFYLVKLEAVRIGESPAAPLLTLIVGPSEENSVRAQKKELAGRYEIRHRWWSQVVAHPKARLHSHITPGSYSWIGAASGIRGVTFNYSVTQEDCSAELYIDRGRESGDESKQIFDQLIAHRREIDTAVQPYKLSWERLDARRACRLRLLLEGGYRSPEDQWAAIQDRLVEAMEKLHSALGSRLKGLKLGP
jgi:hypothetical protein